jgi:hypothetical protein
MGGDAMRLILLLAVVLAGCDAKEPVKKDWESAPKEYRCTDEQIERVHQQAAWCDKNTTYYSTYCYGIAFIRNCTKATGEQQ